jgi:hypothetical protein
MFTIMSLDIPYSADENTSTVKDITDVVSGQYGQPFGT